MSQQLTDLLTLDLANVVIEKEKEEQAGDTKAFRSRISVIYPNGQVGPLLIMGPQNLERGEDKGCMSFGIQENRDKTSNRLTGYSMAVSLSELNTSNSEYEPSEEQAEWLEKFDALCAHIQTMLIDNYDQYTKLRIVAGDTGKKKKQLTEEELMLRRGALLNELKKVKDPLYRKDSKSGETTGATLYPKIIERKPKKNSEGVEIGQRKMLSVFYEWNSDTVIENPLQSFLTKKKEEGGELMLCRIRPAIKLDSIYFGSKVSFQIKLWEAEIQKIETQHRRVIPRPKFGGRLKTQDSEDPRNTPHITPVSETSHTEEVEDTGSLGDATETVTKPVAKPSRRPRPKKTE